MRARKSMETASSSARPWSDLPDLVLHNIVLHLTDMSSYAAFASVCRSWRYVSKAALVEFLASQPPSLVAYPSFIELSEEATYNMITITDKKIYTRPMPHMLDIWCRSKDRRYSRFQCSHGCLIGRRENNYGWRADSNSGTSASPVLHNPFTGSTIFFPPAPSDFLYVALSALPTSPDCSMLLIAHDFFDYCVMSCGINSNEWTVWRVPHHINTSGWLGAVLLKDKVYVRHNVEGISEGDASSSELKLLDTKNTDDILEDTFGCHLVGLGMELLMITEKPKPAKDLIEAYRLDWLSMAWKRVMDIGHHAVFLHMGVQQSAEIYDTKRMKGAMRNCVYHAGSRQSMFSVIPLSGGATKATSVDMSLERDFPEFPAGHSPVWVSMTGMVEGYSAEA